MKIHTIIYQKLNRIINIKINIRKIKKYNNNKCLIIILMKCLSILMINQCNPKFSKVILYFSIDHSNNMYAIRKMSE